MGVSVVDPFRLAKKIMEVRCGREAYVSAPNEISAAKG